MALNRFGAAFLSRVGNALSELEQGRRELHEAAGLASGTVAVAAETLRTVTGLVAGFLRVHPDVSFRLRQVPPPAMPAELLAGDVDLCLASQPLAGTRSAELLSEEVLLGVPPGHRLAGRDRVAIGELATEPFVTTRAGYWQRALADELFGRSGVRPVIACEGDEPYTIRGLISAGVGIGLLPALARSTPDPPVGWVRLDAPGCQRTLRIAWREDAYLPAAARSFCDFAISTFRERPPSD